MSKITSLALLCFLLLPTLIFLSHPATASEVAFRNLQTLFSKDICKELAAIEYQITRESKIPEDKIEALQPAIDSLQPLDTITANPADFNAVFGSKPNFNTLRAGGKTLLILSVYYGQKKQSPKAVLLLKHLYLLSSGFLKTSDNYPEDQTGTLLEYMVGVALTNIATKASSLLYQLLNDDQATMEELAVLLSEHERQIPDMFSVMKSEFLTVKKMIVEAKQHQKGYFSLMENLNGLNVERENHLDTCLVETLQQSEDARFVYDLYMDDAIMDYQKFLTPMFEMIGKPHQQSVKLLEQMEQSLMEGKPSHNFITMMAIPNFRRAREQEMKCRRLLKLASLGFTLRIKKVNNVSAIQQFVSKSSILDPLTGENFKVAKYKNVIYLYQGITKQRFLEGELEKLLKKDSYYQLPSDIGIFSLEQGLLKF